MWYIPWGGPKPPATGNMKLQEENKGNSVSSVQISINENPPRLPPSPGASHLLVSTWNVPAGLTEPKPSPGNNVIPQGRGEPHRATKHSSDPPSSPGTALTHPQHPQETLGTHTARERVSFLCRLSTGWINISSWKYLTQQDY